MNKDKFNLNIMKKLPHWLKGGVTLGSIFLIIPILLTIVSFVIKDSWKVLIRASLFPTLQFFSSKLDGPPVASFLVITLVINTVFWFLIGCLMGWIIGKIKMKNV